MRQLEIQGAIFSALQSMTPAVYDDVPDQAGGLTFPYIVIGDATSRDWSDDTYTGTDNTVTIHVWSRYPGYLEAKELMREIDARLNRAELTVADASLLTCDLEYAEAMRDPDGETRHGVMRFRVVVTSA